MRHVFCETVESGRIPSGSKPRDPFGMFHLLCPVLHRTLSVMVSDGKEWQEPVSRPSAERLAKLPISSQNRILEIWGERKFVILPLPAWEHVSVSARSIPSWEEMCWVKNLFWEPNECVVQFHPSETMYVNIHSDVLHLWKPIGIEFPMPPLECV